MLSPEALQKADQRGSLVFGRGDGGDADRLGVFG
jgi:hypothetical protein